jgi:hypothetical protein
MARPNFFNDNRNRTFPFQQGTAGISTPASGSVTMHQLPDEFIVDCGFVMGPESGFLEDEHTIFLYKISRASLNVFLFEFRSDASELAATPLIFSRNLSAADYTTEFLESDIPEYIPLSQSVSLSLSESQAAECGEPFWSGYLVTGSMQAIVARLSIGDTIIRTSPAETIIEPALIQNLNESQVVSVNIANGDRTRALRPDYCPPNEWNFNTGEIYVNRKCLQGDVKLRAGYNISLNQIALSNTIQLSASVNAGLGEPCEEVKLFPGETPPIGAPNNLLAGDFYCNEVLRAINGLQGPNLVIFAGSGVSITADQPTNTVLIDVDLVDLSACTFSAVSESI